MLIGCCFLRFAEGKRKVKQAVCFYISTERERNRISDRLEENYKINVYTNIFFFFFQFTLKSTYSISSTNRRFPEITGKDNLTVFSYSGRVKSPEWRRQLRRADLRQFQIFRHGPVIIYTRLPAGGTYYPICMFPTNSERLIGISDAFSAFVYGYPSSCPRAHCTPNKSVPTLRYTRRHGPVYTGHACRHLLSSVPWISEDRLLKKKEKNYEGMRATKNTTGAMVVLHPSSSSLS